MGTRGLMGKEEKGRIVPAFVVFFLHLLASNTPLTLASSALHLPSRSSIFFFLRALDSRACTLFRSRSLSRLSALDQEHEEKERRHVTCVNRIKSSLGERDNFG
jgi:hypothetical protein